MRSGRRSGISGAGGVCLLLALSWLGGGTAVATGASSPTFGSTVVLAPVAGKVLIRVPGAPAFSRLTAARIVPVRTVVDTTAGTVRLTSANPPPGRVQSGQFFEGRFQVAQDKGGGGLVSLVLQDTSSRHTVCKLGAARAAALSQRILGVLRGSAKGRFRTVGRFSAATVLGTNWGVRDRCDGTLTVVRTGVVAVRDFVQHRTVIVRAGETYLAKAP